jgi:hypothetical protein
MNGEGEKEKVILPDGRDIDPSALTTQMVWRENQSLKELLEARITGVEKGIEIAHQDLVRVPTEVQKAISGLKEVLETARLGDKELILEKFRNIDKLFGVVEQARIEQKKDTATAVDAALKAAKEAVTEQNASNAIAISKSEAATTKQIDQQAMLIQTTSKTLDDKINDIKENLKIQSERITKIEAITLGSNAATTEHRSSGTYNVGIIGLIIGTLIGLGGLIFAILKSNQ